MNKRDKKRLKRAAAKAPAWLRDIAASKSTKQFVRNAGTFGAASPVRHIAPDQRPS